MNAKTHKSIHITVETVEIEELNAALEMFENDVLNALENVSNDLDDYERSMVAWALLHSTYVDMLTDMRQNVSREDKKAYDAFYDKFAKNSPLPTSYFYL